MNVYALDVSTVSSWVSAFNGNLREKGESDHRDKFCCDRPVPAYGLILCCKQREISKHVHYQGK